MLKVFRLGKNRDRVDLVAAILDAASVRGGIGKTRIMFEANLSFKLVEKYLRIVLRLGFVQIKGSYYGLTEEGRMFLQRYRRFREHHIEAQNHLMTLDHERKSLWRLCEGSEPIVVEKPLLNER